MHAIIAEIIAIKYFARNTHLVIGLTFHAIHINAYNVICILGRHLAVAATQVLAQFVKSFRSINELYLVVLFVIAQQPYIGTNTRIVENIVRQLYNGIN
ncbi:hypothetical protein EVA_06880 [gut metagenome]|uniref:Uncharacterized protein n=1 Tax=gut metagenome TaxID=749906 RepID=J9GWJ7_9ZZZZ